MTSKNNLPQLLLVSTSPRRRQILESLNLPFKTIQPIGDEAVAEALNVESVTMNNSLVKAKSALAHAQNETDILIGSDTLVVLGQQVMGKPLNKDEAIEMLSRLSGQWHRVVTGLALVSRKYGELKAFESSQIKFRVLTKEEINSYVATKEPYDKAGSYAVQGLGALLIEKIEGSYTNVMGFPVEKFLMELNRFTQISLQEWFS
ncbi:MAG: septum formation protein Maf [Deltaproteobacteria bacterium]|nr:septum formation protein Maf [Deltaproteobacteria bacterium]